MVINVCSSFLNDDILPKILEMDLRPIPIGISETKWYETHMFFIKLFKKYVKYATTAILCLKMCTKKDKRKTWKKETIVYFHLPIPENNRRKFVLSAV
jgi:hypothetical protein